MASGEGTRLLLAIVVLVLFFSFIFSAADQTVVMQENNYGINNVFSYSKLKIIIHKGGGRGGGGGRGRGAKGGKRGDDGNGGSTGGGIWGWNGGSGGSRRSAGQKTTDCNNDLLVISALVLQQ